jgi:hypothetical protein
LFVRIPDHVDCRLRLNLTGRSDRTCPPILIEGDRFSVRLESSVTMPEWSVMFARNEAEFALELTFSWLSCPILNSGEPMPAKRSAMRKIKEGLRLKFTMRSATPVSIGVGI